VLAAAGLAACGGRVEPAVVAGGDPAVGRSLVRAYGCTACHRVPGVRGPHALVGPPLTAWSRRVYVAGRAANTPDNLVRFLLEPASIAPGTAMPDVGLTEEHARHIAAYLYRVR
jgi:cytochrome c